MPKDKFQIAVLGSHREDLDQKLYELSVAIGEEITNKGYVLLTGAATGISAYAVCGAKKQNDLTIDIGPAYSKSNFSL